MVLFALCLLILDQGQFESYLEMTNFKIGLYNKIYAWTVAELGVIPRGGQFTLRQSMCTQMCAVLVPFI